MDGYFAEREAWLAALKPGDEVARQGGGWERSYELGTCVSVSKSRNKFVCKFRDVEHVYNKYGREPRGKDHSRWHRYDEIEKPTDEIREAIEREKLTHFISVFHRRLDCKGEERPSMDTLRRVAKAIRGTEP